MECNGLSLLNEIVIPRYIKGKTVGAAISC